MPWLDFIDQLIQHELELIDSLLDFDEITQHSKQFIHSNISEKSL